MTLYLYRYTAYTVFLRRCVQKNLPSSSIEQSIPLFNHNSAFRAGQTLNFFDRVMAFYRSVTTMFFRPF